MKKNKIRNIKWIATRVGNKRIRLTFFDKQGNEILVPTIKNYLFKKKNEIKQKTDTK